MRTLVCMVVLTACGGTASSPGGDTGATSSGPSVEAGAQLYSSQCAVCHGANGEGGSGAALTGGTIDNMTDDEIVEQVENGAFGMPSFTFTADELDSLVLYLRDAFGS